jgi:hypothetical protein
MALSDVCDEFIDAVVRKDPASDDVLGAVGKLDEALSYYVAGDEVAFLKRAIGDFLKVSTAANFDRLLFEAMSLRSFLDRAPT